jgi:sn-glycerol 3-phosphate transport system permease protein
MEGKRTNWLIHILLSVACLIIAAPILFALIKATQTGAAVNSANLTPGTKLFENIAAAWRQGNLGNYMKNSLLIALAVTTGKTILSLFAGMALVFFRFPLKPIVFGFVLFTLMMPTEVLIVGLFDFLSLRPPANWQVFWEWFRNPANVFFKPTTFGLGWADSYLAIIVPFLASATGTFLFRQHFMSIPRSLADAAKIDGASPLRFLTSILIPMSWNTIGALAVIQFVYVWDQYLWPRVIIQQEDKQVVQVGLKLIIGVGQGTQWGEVMAGAIIALLPPLIVFILLQEQFMRGFALSESK